MFESEFEHEMKRLVSVYGKPAYPSERMKIIFDMLKNDSLEILSEAVTDLIANSKAAPMLKEICNAMSAAREKESREKVKAENEASEQILNPTQGSAFEPSDIKNMFQMLYKKMAGQISKSEFDEYMQSVKDFLKKTKQKSNCAICEDRGYVLKTIYLNDYAYRCSCKAGDKFPAYPSLDGRYSHIQKPNVTKSFKNSTRPHYYGD